MLFIWRYVDWYLILELVPLATELHIMNKCISNMISVTQHEINVVFHKNCMPKQSCGGCAACVNSELLLEFYSTYFFLYLIIYRQSYTISSCTFVASALSQNHPGFSTVPEMWSYSSKYRTNLYVVFAPRHLAWILSKFSERMFQRPWIHHYLYMHSHTYCIVQLLSKNWQYHKVWIIKSWHTPRQYQTKLLSIILNKSFHTNHSCDIKSLGRWCSPYITMNFWF